MTIYIARLIKRVLYTVNRFFSDRKRNYLPNTFEWITAEQGNQSIRVGQAGYYFLSL